MAQLAPRHSIFLARVYHRSGMCLTEFRQIACQVSLRTLYHACQGDTGVGLWLKYDHHHQSPTPTHPAHVTSTVTLRTLQWRHVNVTASQITDNSTVSSNSLFGADIKETSKIRVTGPLWWDFTGDRWIPLTKTSYGESVSMSWRHTENVSSDHQAYWGLGPPLLTLKAF